MNKTVKGYKAMNADMTCKGQQYEVGQTYKLNSVSMCKAGFHFCENVFDVYNYYPKSVDTIVCEVEASEEIQKEGDKSVTNTLKIVKKLNEKELLEIWINKTNSGDYNSGDRNSGNSNSGNRNSGNSNSGNSNSGDYNSGHCNSGNRNSGNYNSGHYNNGSCNSGDRNSGNSNSGNYNSGHYNSGHCNNGSYNSGDHNNGDHNSGDCNSGDYNSGDYNSGFFNTETAKVKLFNKECDLSWNDERLYKLKYLNIKPILEWVPESNMSDEEKRGNPSAKTTGGFLRNTGRLNWSNLTVQDKELIKSLPGFDANVFKVISGIDLDELDTIEIIVNGQKKTLSKVKAKELKLID